ncbi:TVP38/TMEM64 family protein [Spirochaeta dissipatitropha]
MKSSTKSLLKISTAVSILCLMLAIGYFTDFTAYLRSALEWIHGIGLRGALLYILLYILITVLLVPGSILTVGSGAVFGVFWGTLLTSIGSTIGAAAAFLIGRFFLRDWVERKARENQRFQAVDEAIGREGGKIIFLLRMSPLMPFNLSNYLYSLSKVNFRSYILASWVGMFPGTLMYVYIGSLIENLSAAALEGRTRSTAEWTLYAAGLVATVIVTIYITRVAQKAVKQAIA